MPGFVYQGKTLLSGHDAAGRAEKIADALPLADRTLYFCPSPLYGYGLSRLLDRLAREAPHSALLCVEAEPALYDIAMQNIVPAAAPQLCITDVREAADLCALVRRSWEARSFRRVELLRLSGGWQLFPELYNALIEALRREIALDWSNALTLTKLGRRYLRNFLCNLALVSRCPSAGSLSYGDSPALVLGAGPSVDVFLDGLQRRFGELIRTPENRPFRIICADTCLSALRSRGIHPDLVVILESQHWNLRDFTGCAGLPVCAAMDLSALPASGRTLSGGLFLFITEWTELRIFRRLEAAGLLPIRLPPLGSVGLAAVELARVLCRGNIIIAGLDFSFTVDAYHARSTPGHTDRLRGQTRFRDILAAAAAFGPGTFAALSKTGKPVRSSPVMRNYRALFEQEFAADPRLYDIAGSGLPLGLKTLTPEAAFTALEKAAQNADGAEPPPNTAAAAPGERERKLRLFLQGEIDRLTALRDILSGAAADSESLESLIDACDYLWAHFPDYAAAAGRRPGGHAIAEGNSAALSFLKRIRAEIDPALILLRQFNR